MSPALPAAIEALKNALFGRSTKHTDAALRRAVAARAVEHGGGPPPAEDIPPALCDYVEKVAKHAYDVTDEDVAALRRAGYSEDAIFELTLAAATGAGLFRREQGLKAIEGD